MSHVHRIDLAGVCTNPGICDSSSLGHGHNWVTKTDPINGLHPYVRAVAHALMRSGHPKSEAIAIAIAAVKKWSHGGGHVTKPTVARGAKAVGEWEALKAADHARSHSLAQSSGRLASEGFPGSLVTQTIDLAAKGGAAKFAARTMPTKAHVRAMAKRTSKWPDSHKGKKAAQALVHLRGKQLGMDPKEYTSPKGAGKGQLFARLARAFNLSGGLNTATRKKLAAKGDAMPGGRYPVRNADDLHNAIRAVGRGKGSHDLIRRYIKRRAAALGLSDQIPDSWSAT